MLFTNNFTCALDTFSLTTLENGMENGQSSSHQQMAPFGFWLCLRVLVCVCVLCAVTRFLFAIGSAPGLKSNLSALTQCNAQINAHRK